MHKNSKLIAILATAAVLIAIPGTAAANVGGASPRLTQTDGEADLIANVGGASPRGTDRLETVAADRPGVVANVGGASPRGLDPMADQTVAQENVGGATPRSLLQMLLDLLLPE